MDAFSSAAKRMARNIVVAFEGMSESVLRVKQAFALFVLTANRHAEEIKRIEKAKHARDMRQQATRAALPMWKRTPKHSRRNRRHL